MIRCTICYDISETSKRTKLSKILEEFGERIQYSVFEFNLTKAQHVRLIKTLKAKGFLEKNKKSTQDRITFYYFDEFTEKKIFRIGKKPMIDRERLLYL